MFSLACAIARRYWIQIWIESLDRKLEPVVVMETNQNKSVKKMTQKKLISYAVELSYVLEQK